ncbi:hypothetical protein TSMEX_007559 [Taenia solium]|eukprot:TsM_000054500 transcript=TsM_000054500 gene=TsM_000054500
MRDVLLGNIVGLARTFETSKVATEVNGQLSEVTEGKENTAPGSILSGAQQTLLDATRRRRMFETSVVNCERSHAQRNIFDILGHLDNTQSPILADTEEVSTPVILTKVEEGEEREERDGFSLTEPHTFSDGVWLDVDRSEGEAGGVAMFEAEEIADLAKESETTNSASEATENRSEGEFTLDQVNHQLGVWVAPWRDPLLHLIALNAAGKNSRLPWNQQHKIQKIAQRLKCGDDDQTCCSSTEDLSWVEGMTGRLGASSPPSTVTNGARSVGEVILPLSVKQLLQKQQLRRAILAKSSQRMRQHDASISDEEDTLRGAVEEAPNEKQDLLSAVKSLSDEESKEKKNDEIDEEGSLESQVDSTSKGDSTFDIDHDASSNFPKGSL